METITAVTKYIVPDLKLWVALEGTTRLYSTSVVGVYKDSFTIYPPVDEEEKLTVTKKHILEFIYINNSGKYSFKSSAIGIVKDKVTLLAVKLPRFLKRSEQRAFFRMDLQRHIAVKFRNDFESDDGRFYQKGQMLTMVCADISGGGIKLLSPIELRVNDKIDIDLSGIVESIGEVEGTIVRRIGKENDKYAFGVMFTALSESERDKIIKRIFQRQTEQIRLNM